MTVTITLAERVSDIDSAEWDACANPGGGVPLDPFTTWRFLSALEGSGSVGTGTGWTPKPMLVHDGGRLIGAVPLYVKSHSQGEYIFDHAWAQGYTRAGGRYYPKLQVAVPFTPATGRRFLAREGYGTQVQEAALGALADLARGNGLSSVHVTFCTAQEAAQGGPGWHRRVTEQFHWENRGYSSYAAFLETLASRKRKALRKERETAQGFGGTIRALSGDDLRPEHWDAFWTFYQDTGARKWGTPYLTRRFFDLVQQTLRDDVLLVLAERDGRAVAGALNFIGRDTLFGRYWGCIEDHPCLHFELCYHQAIDHAIARGLSRVEAGAQGEHKLARGYLPVPVHSLHHIPDPGFDRAVARYLDEERRAVAQDIEILSSCGPFRRGPLQEDTP
jgi:uncharacterized protein